MSNPKLQYLAYESTPLGLLCLREREHPFQSGITITELTLNHEFLMSSFHTASEQALASLSLEMHPGQDLKVLVGGLGLGYTAHEVLKCSRVKQLDVIEYLPQVIDWIEQDLFPLASQLKEEPRLNCIAGDIYQYLANSPKHLYDLILIDVDHSPDENLHQQNISFYGVEGLERAKKHLAPGGLLAVWSYASSSPFSEALKQVFKQVRLETISFENTLLNEKETDWLFLAND